MQIFWSGSEVVEHQLPDIGFWVEYIVPKLGIVLLHGKYGSYKTPISVHLAYCVATGQPFLGLHVEQTPVLYIEGDTPMVGIWPRLQAMNPKTDQLDFAFIYPGFNVVQPKQGEHNKMVCDQLSERHSSKHYGMVIVDSLRTSHTLADKDSEVPTMVYGAFSRLFPGATVFIIHHDRKTKIPDGKGNGRINTHNTEIDNESFSGSQAWIDRATTSLKLTKGYGGEKEWITFAQTKSQVGPEIAPLYIKVEDGHRFALASDLSMDKMALAIATIGLVKNRQELDRELSKYFGVPLRMAKEQRIHYEQSVKPLTF